MALRTRLATGLAIGLAACLFATAPAHADADHALVNMRMGLRESTLVQLDAVYPRAQPILADVELGGHRYTLDLHPYSVRAENYRVYAIGDDGVLTPQPPTPVNTLRGVLRGVPGSRVAAAVMDDGLQATVALDDGSRWWIEPIARRTGLVPDGRHVVYRESDVLPSGGTCLAQAAEEMGGGLVPSPWEYPGGHNTPDGGGGGGGVGPGQPMSEAELGIDADYPYYLLWGSETEDRINTVINTVNIQFESEVSISHTITAILIRTTLGGDPYTTTSPSALLGQFRTNWLVNHPNIPRDVAHLFTARDLDSNVIGIAFGLGQICSTGAFCLSQSDCCGSLGCATDLTAHELGHLWNGSHCSCTNPNYTMNPFITCANTFHPIETVPEMAQHRDSRLCLNAPALHGACCFSDGSCFGPVFAADCAASSGIYQGDHTSCGATLCSAIGACCLPSGECLPFSPSDCTENFGGIYLGDGVLCTASTCASTGACCVEGACQIINETSCVTFGGWFAGTGSTCTAQVCASGLGACCLGDGACQSQVEADCASAGGTFLGVGENCLPSSCPGTGCPGDLDGSGATGFADLNQLMTAWGPCPGCPEDIDGDGFVGFADMSQLLNGWGPCVE